MDTSACIINELIQGKDLAMHLKSILCSESSSDTKHVLIQQIISSYDRAILMVNRGDSGGQTPPMPTQPESSVSIEESPRSQDFNQPFDNQQEDKVVSKKRSYYRCTYRYIHHCMARKQVQRTNEDPTVFEITYKGQHSCNPTASPSAAPPQSPEKHDPIEHNNHQLSLPPKSGVSTSDFDATVPYSFSFPSASFGSIENYQQPHLLQGYSPSFISPTTSGSNNLTESSSYFQHHDDSNSSLTFTTDPQDLSRNFPFNNSGYFM